MDVAEWHAGIEGGGDEPVAQGVRADAPIPAALAIRLTILAAAWRSRRPPSLP